jgi:hypothetical protein
MTDRLKIHGNLPIDIGIESIMETLTSIGFETTDSCSGLHPGNVGPFVRIRLKSRDERDMLAIPLSKYFKVVKSHPPIHGYPGRKLCLTPKGECSTFKFWTDVVRVFSGLID